MNRNKILELAKKIKALAEKGKDGEKNAAKEKLEKICLKYNISSTSQQSSHKGVNCIVSTNNTSLADLIATLQPHIFTFVIFAIFFLNILLIYYINILFLNNKRNNFN